MKIIGIIVLLVFMYYLGSSGGGNGQSSPSLPAQATASPIEILQSSEAAAISPEGELAAMFTIGTDYTDLQRQMKLKEILGQVVEWELPVYDIRLSGDTYVVQTQQRFRGALRPQVVGTFTRISALSDADRQFLASVKTGDVIRIKGRIQDVHLRNLEIAPAILSRSAVDQIMTEAFGHKSPSNGCWIVQQAPESYCMRVFREDKLTLPTGILHYMLALGQPIDAQGQPTIGTHASSGLVAAFVYELDNGAPRVIAKGLNMGYGEFATPPRDWKFVEFGADGSWGWQTISGFRNHGYEEARHVILIARGKDIVDIARDLPALKSDIGAKGDESGVAIGSTIWVNASNRSDAIFPLLVNVSKTTAGKSVAQGEFELRFSEKQGKYVVPPALAAMFKDNGN